KAVPASLDVAREPLPAPESPVAERPVELEHGDVVLVARSQDLANAVLRSPVDRVQLRQSSEALTAEPRHGRGPLVFGLAPLGVDEQPRERDRPPVTVENRERAASLEERVLEHRLAPFLAGPAGPAGTKAPASAQRP